jgi:hypothetical protein
VCSAFECTNPWRTLRPVAPAGPRRKSGAGDLIRKKISKWNQLDKNLKINQINKNELPYKMGFVFILTKIL